MWTPEAIAAKRGLIQARAYKHWAKWHGTLDRSFLEDLEQEAWVAALAVDPEHPYLPRSLMTRCGSPFATGDGSVAKFDFWAKSQNRVS